MTYLLDTNVLSETRKPNPNPGVAGWIADIPVERLHLSVITLGEIGRAIAGLRERGDHRQLAIFETWLDDVIEAFGDRIVPVTVEIAREWGTRQPTPQGLIAATAKVHGWTLVTRNTKDFERSGVRIFNPFTSTLASPS